MKAILKIILLVIILGLSNEYMKSQEKALTNMGKEFYFAYMPNFHNNKYDFYGNTTTNDNDTLFIFISSDVPTFGNLEYTDRQGIEHSETFVIIDPSEIFVYKFHYENFELIGQNDAGNIIEQNDCEIPQDYTFKITSNEDITVVIHNEAQYTSDACLLYPKRSLAKNYFVFSYNSNIVSSKPSRTPSQFIIVGTEDNTEVTINPTAPTFRNGQSEQNIILDEGEVYLVQADIINIPDYPAPHQYSYDLTGSRVRSNKPVAVLGGHQRANIPYTEIASRDILMSQMIPLESWGLNVFITPFYQPDSVKNPASDITRITAAYDDTRLYIAGNYFTTINESDVLDLDIDSAMYITGDKPIRASLYKKSTFENLSLRGVGISDPFLVLYPPKEQFLNKYNIICLDVNEPIESGDSIYLDPKYEDHYVNIIIPTESKHTLTINGDLVDTNEINFTEIAGIEYSYADIRVSEGTHKLAADEKFGVTVYGYGQTNSYGYVGGLGLDLLDWTPPHDVFTTDSCLNGKLIITENFEQDGGFKDIEITNSVNLDFDVVDSTDSRLEINISVKDPYNDAQLYVTATDSIGSITRSINNIPGFTFTTSGDSLARVDTMRVIKSHREKCISVQIKNYGFLDKLLSGLYLKNDNFTIKNLPDTIKAGDSIMIDVCYESNYKPGQIFDTLNIEYGCIEETIATVAFDRLPDENIPNISISESECKDQIRLIAEDIQETDYGLENYEVINLENLELVESESDFQMISLDLKLTDPYQDGVYEIKFTDLAGNDTTVTGIIQGFTITASPQVNDEAKLVFETQKVGNTICGEITLTNYGLLPLTFDNVFVTEKLNFFIPQSQLPFTIEPDSSKELTICFMSSEVSDEMLEDILKLDFNCLTKDIRVQGDVEEFQMSGTAACDYNVKFVFGETPGSIYLDNSYPNPTDNSFTARFGTDEDRSISLKLIDTEGNQYDIFEDNYQEGSYELEVDVSNLPTGIYFLEMISGKKRLSNSLVIER